MFNLNVLLCHPISIPCIADVVGADVGDDDDDGNVVPLFYPTYLMNDI